MKHKLTQQDVDKMLPKKKKTETKAESVTLKE